MSCGEGGIITTNNEHYAQLARKIAGHGYKNLGASYGQIKLNQSVYQDPNYKRHDEIGWNYRMPEFNAAIALAQLEHLEHKVEQRKVVANMFIDALSNCDISWQEFREKYISFGGDGFYGAWSVPYLEPVMQNRTFVKRYPEIYEDVVYEKGLCPVAESIQPKIMQFKTNYRDIDLASRKAKALKNTIDFFNKTEELPSV